jgi:hypothetical protein
MSGCGSATDGGATDLAHGRLLCGWHHAKAHDPTYEMTHRSGGRPPSTDVGRRVNIPDLR